MGRDTAEKGLVVFLPALGASVDFYRTMAEAWAALGYRVATVELRGGRQSSVKDVRAQNFGYNEVLNVDLASIVPRLRAEAAGGTSCSRVTASAGSSRCSMPAVIRRRLTASCCWRADSNYYGAMPPGQRFTRHLGLRLVRVIDQVLRFFPGDKLGFGGRQPFNMMLDWTQEALTGKYRVKGDPADYNRELEQLDGAGADGLLAGGHAGSATQRGLPGHEAHPRPGCPDRAPAEDGKAYHHFRWVKKPAAILAQVDQWIGARFVAKRAGQ